MSLLCIDLDSGRIWQEELSSSAHLYAFSSLQTDPDALFIIAPSADSIRYSGSSEVSFIYTSPITGKPSLSHSNLAFGRSLIKMERDGIMIKGSSLKLSYITIDNDRIEILPSESLRGKSSEAFREICSRGRDDDVLALGPAGDNGVIFSSLQYRGRNIRGEGLGYVFYRKGLKGIVISVCEHKEKEEPDALYKKVRKTLEHSRIARRVRKEGSCALIDDALRLGWLPVRTYSSRFDPRAYGLDGKSLIDRFGIHPSTCHDCFFSCGRMSHDDHLLPYWKDMAALGSNLGFFSADNVLMLFDAAMEEGLDTKYLGAILSYVISLPDDDMHWLGLKDRTPESIAELIHRIGSVKEAGLRYKDGLASFPDAYQSGYHQALVYDLRGSFGEALMLMLGLDIELPASLFLSPVEMDAECAAIFALYEAVYSLALISLGYSPMAATAFSEKIPAIAYRIPSLARLSWHHYKAFGMSGRDLFRIGFPIFESLIGEKRDLPSHFMRDAESAKSLRAVPAVKLFESYKHEKLRAQIWEKSRRENKVRPVHSKRTAVGPAEDLGRDGEPGLTK